MTQSEKVLTDSNMVIHGDSTTAESYHRALSGQPCQMLFADPPYCLLVRRNSRGKKRDPKRAKINHEAVKRYENVREYRTFTHAWMQHACTHLTPTGHAVIWTNFLGQQPILDVAKALGLHFHGTYQWAKLGKKGQGNERLARLYEVGLIFGMVPAPPLSPSDPAPPRYMISGYDVEGEAQTWNNHPNHKPYTVLEPLLRHYTQPGDRILDPFSGSGSTAAACVKLNRRVSAIELRPHWAQTSQQRLARCMSQSIPSQSSETPLP